MNLPPVTMTFTSMNESSKSLSNAHKYFLESDFWRFLNVTNKLSPVFVTSIRSLRLVSPFATLRMTWLLWLHGLSHKYLTYAFTLENRMFQPLQVNVTSFPRCPRMSRGFSSTKLRAASTNHCHSECTEQSTFINQTTKKYAFFKKMKKNKNSPERRNKYTQEFFMLKIGEQKPFTGTIRSTKLLTLNFTPQPFQEAPPFSSNTHAVFSLWIDASVRLHLNFRGQPMILFFFFPAV